ncbi:MAG: tRNA (N(6)-L-threonylcarbamoyladenosine(37)-C(2))-methylthiotransferase MtaB [Desulfatitalea sp.]|nr:tRNA (N(6)-L-threonylcarbamoyladenosine(37)-C(2))-methylthiotransferase MtaB [Desulfatitalea sp.]
MKSYRVITLGCKVNQCESAAVGHLLEQCGYVHARQDHTPDTVVINTCTVTSKAAMQSRQAIRKSVRAYPDAHIVVTGCHAEIAAEQVGAMEGVHLVVGNTDKMRLATLLAEPVHDAGFQRPTADPSVLGGPCFAPMPAVSREDRTRAFLKVQDGCNTRCTYCIVPYTRGPSRSMPEAEVETHIRRLAEQGLREVVLTGIHLGAYGSDLVPATSLTLLIDRLTRKPLVDRIRVSSIEPTEISPSLVDLFASRPERLCPHFHVPLQSGDNRLLRRMGRPYTREQYAAVIHDIRHRLPRAAIGVDVMAGFPGEGDDAFAQTCELIASLPITYLHVFPFSPRHGTPAEKFTSKIPQRVAKERCQHLRRLGENKRQDFLRTMMGQQTTVLIQTLSADTPGEAFGISDNYLPIKMTGGPYQENSLVRAEIRGISDDGRLIGTDRL